MLIHRNSVATPMKSGTPPAPHPHREPQNDAHIAQLQQMTGSSGSASCLPGQSLSSKPSPANLTSHARSRTPPLHPPPNKQPQALDRCQNYNSQGARSARGPPPVRVSTHQLIRAHSHDSWFKRCRQSPRTVRYPRFPEGGLDSVFDRTTTIAIPCAIPYWHASRSLCISARTHASP